MIAAWLGLIIGASPKVYYSLIANNWVPSYERYGDLYRFSNLPQFKLAQPDCRRPFFGKDSAQKQEIALYTVGDSFLELWRINEHDFDYKKYTTIHWFQENTEIILDKRKTNILLLESVERHAREKFAKVPLNFKPVSYYGEGAVYLGGKKIWLKNKWNELKNYFFTPETNDHLEHVFFAADWILPLKELKASFNFHVFDRVNPTAAASKDKKHIMYYMDTDSTKINSSYAPLADAEIDELVQNMDSTVQAYKKAGFDHVIVNIIPNKASIVAPKDGKYNFLAQRFEEKAKGKFPYVGVYQDFAKNPMNVYGINETHWSCLGKDIWVKNVTNKITELTHANTDNLK